MIKVIERKTSIQIHCTHADWPLVRWCLDEGLKNLYLNRNGAGHHTLQPEELKAWKRNGSPHMLSDMPQIDKS